MHDLERLTRQNLELLAQARELVEALSDEIFTAATPPLSQSGVGAHLRHCLDYYHCFLTGLPKGRIDYDLRTRDRRLETERTYAVETIDRIRRDLESRLEGRKSGDGLDITSDNPAPEEQEPVWCSSSLQRELQALISHTVHHFALIAMLLRAHGFDPGYEFGVAPSTLDYWRQNKAARAS